MRERGLKFFDNRKSFTGDLSLPVRERGLKYTVNYHVTYKVTVAPRAGAWIEIQLYCLYYSRVIVDPRAGAWIEIF